MPDIDEAERLVTEMHGVENSWTGRVIARVVRHVRQLTRATQRLDERVTALEQQAAPPPPPVSPPAKR